ncbi:Dehydrocurvularin biosynthesis regulator [Ceratocystis fimbriata CBS 114723]|uniref:Dehydrocurvularin biosynthesis regulator n=1 Tax=Ceratocystis fimbriata CBS 114723 TaxID=1035309 RepID=A0A2C5WP74_9PEZI|nr:Dehydrocurvularin biosynthesis regulator [Ceratocystis fimbriata CBS 114723]
MQDRKRKQPPSEGCSDTNTVGAPNINPISTPEKFQATEGGKRRVRKGTKSCWQCRRRKIKCEYKTANSAVCIRCTEKGEPCRSQEYPEEPGPDERSEPTASSTRTVHQRLSEMERALQLVVKVVDPTRGLMKDLSLPPGTSASVADETEKARSLDGASIADESEIPKTDIDPMMTSNPKVCASVDASPARQQVLSHHRNRTTPQQTPAPLSLPRSVPPPPSSKIPSTGPSCISSLQIPPSCSSKKNHRFNNVLAWQYALPSPNFSESSRTGLYALPPTIPRSQKLDALRTRLLPLFLPQEDINRIFENSSGIYFIMSTIFPIKSIIGSRIPAMQDIKSVPSPTSHPLCMARKLLQMAVIIQHLEPTLDADDLTVKKPLPLITEEWYNAVSCLITSDDELLVNLEGLECLLLQCLFMANMGSLRKAWIVCRRAINFAQLMGLGQGVRFMVPSVDHETDPSWKPAPGFLWYRLNFFDRYTSLLLGLSTATHDTSFATPGVLAELSPTERLERILTIASARISDRNTLRPHNARELTMSIYNQITSAAHANGAEWWKLPDFCGVTFTAETLLPNLQIMVQMHFFSLVIILHLPYMMKGATTEQRAYSRCRCLCASREVLTRYCSMRCNAMSGMMCRHIDYTSLVGSMTVLLSYLDQNAGCNQLNHEEMCEFRGTATVSPEDQKDKDRELVVNTQKILKDVAERNNDKLTAEAAAIVDQLMPIIDPKTASTTGLCHINVPYLGTVTLRTLKTQDDDNNNSTSQSTQEPEKSRTTAAEMAATDPAMPSVSSRSTTNTVPIPSNTTLPTSRTSPVSVSVPSTESVPGPIFTTSTSLPTGNIAVPPGIQEIPDMGDLFTLDPELTTYLDFCPLGDADFIGMEQQEPDKATHDACINLPQNVSQQSVEGGIAMAHRQNKDSQCQMHQSQHQQHSHHTQQHQIHQYYPQQAATQPIHTNVMAGQINNQANTVVQGQNLPGLAADAGRWAFQGVDTNYWTLFGQPFGDDIEMPHNHE